MATHGWPTKIYSSLDENNVGLGLAADNNSPKPQSKGRVRMPIILSATGAVFLKQ